MNQHYNINLRARRERSREYLTQDEVSRLLAASRDTTLSRNPERDYCLLFLIWRHGLRVSEACKLKLSDVDLKERFCMCAGSRTANLQRTRCTMAN
jgi:integrase